MQTPLGEEALGREHRLGFANSGDTMFPAFVPAQDFDFHPQKINRHFQIRLGQTRHAHRVFFGGDDHRQVTADTTVDEADQFRFGVVMMIDVAFREIDVRAEFGKRALKTFRRSNRAQRTDERIAQTPRAAIVRP